MSMVSTSTVNGRRRFAADQDFAERLAREKKDLPPIRAPATESIWRGPPARNSRRPVSSASKRSMASVDGRSGRGLFWSHGVVRVGTRIRVGIVYRGTPIADREFYFRLPAERLPLALGTEPQATGGYYKDKEGHAIYDHLKPTCSASGPIGRPSMPKRRKSGWPVGR